MIKIKFNGATDVNDVSFARINNHVVELGGIADAPKTGFTTWRMDGVTQLGDFSGYTTVYRILDNAVQLLSTNKSEKEKPSIDKGRRI